MELLHICDSCIAWSICRTPDNGSGAVPGALVGSWEPILHDILPCQPEYRKRCLFLQQLDIPCFADAHKRPLILFEWIWRRAGWEYGEGVWREGDGGKKEGEALVGM